MSALKLAESNHAELDEGSKVLLWELGRRIVRLRKTRNWTRADLARRVRVSRERLGHWERGSSTPPLEGLVGLSRELETSLDELVKGTAFTPQPPPSRSEGDEIKRFMRDLARQLKTLLGDGMDEGAETPQGDDDLLSPEDRSLPLSDPDESFVI